MKANIERKKSYVNNSNYAFTLLFTEYESCMFLVLISLTIHVIMFSRLHNNFIMYFLILKFSSVTLSLNSNKCNNIFKI